ncbi:MAG: hypothetical protein R3D71_09955 [Rickettsiales bacterium]
MQTEPLKTLKPDAKGRIALGKLADGVSSFHVSVDRENRIILDPYTEIPAREAWIFGNKEALSSVLRGIDQSQQGQTQSLGSFKGYAED